MVVGSNPSIRYWMDYFHINLIEKTKNKMKKRPGWPICKKAKLIGAKSKSRYLELTIAPLGKWCGTVGRAVACDTRGPRFESSHWQNLYCTLVYFVYYQLC